MKLPVRQRGQTLILLGAWLFFGGGATTALLVYDRSPSEIRKVIKQVVTDEDRQKAILSDIRDWESGQETRDEIVSEGRERLLKALRKQDTRRSEVEPILSSLDATLTSMDREFLDLRFKVKSQVTSAEWARIIARPARE
jgi:predicted Zn-ribbon and HTH transcriptional regulator